MTLKALKTTTLGTAFLALTSEVTLNATELLLKTIYYNEFITMTLLHSVPFYKERLKILTSLFFRFSRFFHGFCSLIFGICIVRVL